MDLNIDLITAQMLNAVKNSLTNDWGKLKDNATTFFQDHKERLETLAEQRLNNEIDDEFLKRRLKDEATILTSDLCAEEIITEAAAQNAANAALDIFSSSIAALLKV